MTQSPLRAVHLALAEQFKFNFETLGLTPAELDPDDIHAVRFLKLLPQFHPRDIEFGETKHVHFNRHLAFGGPVTGYPLPSGVLTDHHFTFETYECLWPFALFEFSAISETAPLVFATDRNFFMECCNATFLSDPSYQKWVGYPIYAPAHAPIFSESGFQALGISPDVLTPGFQMPDLPIASETLATLNFCQQLFFSATLILWGLQQFFGADIGQSPAFLHSHWHPISGENRGRFSSYDQHFLAYLYLVIHPAATLLAYGVYRNKYGVESSHRTTLFVQEGERVLALKDRLKLATQDYLSTIETAPHISMDIQEKARAAIHLGQLFGIGYSTVPEKGQNPHWNTPHTFDAPRLAHLGMKVTVEHDVSSPLWRLFYDYAGEWWTIDQIQQIAAGQGPEWTEFQQHPRAAAIHCSHQIVAAFWQQHLDKIQTDVQRDTCIQQLKALHLI